VAPWPTGHVGHPYGAEACAVKFLDRLTPEERARLRAYAKAEADAAPPITSGQWTELHGLIWPDASGCDGLPAPGRSLPRNRTQGR
jgi:hypothetical protein